MKAVKILLDSTIQKMYDKETGEKIFDSYGNPYAFSSVLDEVLTERQQYLIIDTDRQLTLSKKQVAKLKLAISRVEETYNKKFH